MLHAGKAKRYSNIRFIELRNQFCLSMFYSCGSGNSKRYGGKRKAGNWCDILKVYSFQKKLYFKTNENSVATHLENKHIKSESVPHAVSDKRPVSAQIWSVEKKSSEYRVKF